MHDLPWMRPLVLAAGVLVPCATLTVTRGAAAPAAWMAAPAAAPSYLQHAAAPLPSAPGSGAARGHLPSSVLPFTAAASACSVDTTDAGNPPSCSTNTSPVRCSAMTDAQQRCSALLIASGGSAARRSVFGADGAGCSVFLPPFTMASASFCSAFGGPPGTDLQCSVLASGARQACSAMNPPQGPGNFCSTMRSGGMGGVHECSVLNGGNRRNFCSMVHSPGLFATTNCSTLAQGSSCSVRVGSRGVCTNFNGAPTGVCSAVATPSHCSVIGGAPGFLCQWP